MIFPSSRARRALRPPIRILRNKPLCGAHDLRPTWNREQLCRGGSLRKCRSWLQFGRNSACSLAKAVNESNLRVKLNSESFRGRSWVELALSRGQFEIAVGSILRRCRVDSGSIWGDTSSQACHARGILRRKAKHRETEAGDGHRGRDLAHRGRREPDACRPEAETSIANKFGVSSIPPWKDVEHCVPPACRYI